MLHATWPPDDPSGVPALDRLHQDLYEALCMLSCTPDHEFIQGYGHLVRQVEESFQKEERWMEEMEFHSLKVHREQHARVLHALHNVDSRVMGGELDLGRKVVTTLLPQWLAFHISTMDASLARSMQAAFPTKGSLYTPAMEKNL